MHLNKSYQNFVILILMLISIDMIEVITAASTNCSTFSDKLRFERIYSRRKRFVVFPPGAAVLASVTLLKALTATQPSGINFVKEVEFYYPLQTSVDEWFPKEPKEPLQLLDYYDNSIEKQNLDKIDINLYSDTQQKKYWQESVHRNRRDIIAHIERVASENGFDIKSCLLRVICEANHYLLPPGKSFFHDVLRIMFTTTHQDNVSDEYSHAMKVSEDECINAYGSTCRYSILGFLLENSK